MNMNRLINMAINQLMRILMRKGTDYIAKRGREGGARSRPGAEGQSQQAEALRKKAQDMAKIRRRL